MILKKSFWQSPQVNHELKEYENRFQAESI